MTKHPSLVAFVLAAALGAAPRADAQATPSPDPLPSPQNVFYGEEPPDSAAPVILFVHGVNGVASDWWTVNDMYKLAFNAGYRTAFISLNPDNTRNNNSIEPNAGVLRAAMPAIVAHFKVAALYVVAHSKGGVDVQAAMLDAAFSSRVKAVFTIATPHLGTELADWAFTTGRTVAASQGLLSPAVASLETATMAYVRSLADPASLFFGVPYYTMSATNYASPPNPLLAVTGPTLLALTGGVPNDGIVTVPRTKLPSSYAVDLGTIPVNHFAAATGSLAFPRINAQIRALEGTQTFKRIASGGFAVDGSGHPLPGDRQNSYPWSGQWFKGKLYVGTGRAFMCVITATNDAARGTHLYPPADPNVECTADPTDLPLRAEIWRYTPETAVWERVYQSPQDVPIEFDANGVPTKFTARDIAFRGMIAFEENHGRRVRRGWDKDAKHKGQDGDDDRAPKHERLYVGGVSASSLFDTLPAYTGPNALQFPPPRMLWTEDGTTWNEVPQKPGTFFGDIGIQTETTRRRGFRSFAAVRDAHGVNHLFVTLSDLQGIGRVLESTHPSRGNNAWRQVSPSADQFPVFTIHEYRNQLYATATLGGIDAPGAYGVFRSDGVTKDPADPTRLLFTPVVVPGEMQERPPRAAISMQEFRGSLYVGSDRPTELIRINPDDTWDLVVGSPRMTSSGFKQPLSGIDHGFDSGFNGHFYTMAAHAGSLYLGTWDWSEILQATPLSGLLRSQFGFDLFKTADGIHWNVLSRTGLGDSFNSAVRTMESTPFGLFVGATNTTFGLQMFANPSVLDLNGDGVIDANDVKLITSVKRGEASGPDDPRDVDRDGRITERDAQALATQCTYRGCAITPIKPALSPNGLLAAGRDVSPNAVLLSWTAAPGAVRYHIYRSDPMALGPLLQSAASLALPGGATVTTEEIRNGMLDSFCTNDTAEVGVCALADAVRTNTIAMQPFHWIGSTSGLTFSDAAPPGGGQAFYYVTAENAAGRISEPTSIAAGPSAAATPTFARLGEEILRMRGTAASDLVAALGRRLSASAAALAAGRVGDSRTELAAIERQLGAVSNGGPAAHAALELARSNDGYLRLAEDRRLPLDAVQAALLDPGNGGIH